jgi:hypothetical protein
MVSNEPLLFFTKNKPLLLTKALRLKLINQKDKLAEKINLQFCCKPAFSLKMVRVGATHFMTL